MIEINGKIYRNLEEAVRKNQSDIADWQGLNTLGVKIVGQVDTPEQLPDASTYGGNYGDGYTVGTEAPFDIYVFTRPNDATPEAHWFNLGDLSGPQGPQGPQGEQGEQGTRGNIWFTGSINPSYSTTYISGDMWLNTSNNDIFSFDGGAWQRVTNIQGPQGPQGQDGDTPTLTIQDGYWYINGVNTGVLARGENGTPGADGSSFTIIAKLDSIDQLPSPLTTPRNDAYVIGNNLYVITGEEGSQDLIWESVAELGGGSEIYLDGVLQKSIEMNNYAKQVDLDSINTNVNTNSNNINTAISNALSKSIVGYINNTADPIVNNSYDVYFATQSADYRIKGSYYNLAIYTNTTTNNKWIVLVTTNATYSGQKRYQSMKIEQIYPLGTTISVDGGQTNVPTLQFTSDPQTQLDGKVDKAPTPANTSTFAITATNINGAQVTVPVTDNFIHNAIAKRTSSGHIRVPNNPDNGFYATNKSYVDSQLESKVDSSKVSVAISGGNIPQWSTNGCLRTSTPVNDYDATPKSYVDAKAPNATSSNTTYTLTDPTTNTIMIGGKVQLSNTNTTVTLPMQMANTNYFVVATQQVAASGTTISNDYSNAIYITTKTTSSFIIHKNFNENNQIYNYILIGKAA